MGYKYKFDNGEVFEFDKEPTPADLAHVRSTLKTKAPEKETSLNIGKALASGFAQTGNTVDRYISQLGIAPLNYIDPDEADKYYKAMEDRIASRNQWANPENTPLSMPEKVVSAVGNLPGMMLSMPMSPATAGAEAINAGESLPRAMGAAAIDTVGNTLGMGLGPMGPNVGARVASSAVINAAQDYATKAATQQLMQTERGKKVFEPTLEDAAVSGIVGGGFGFMKPQGKETKSNVRKNLLEEQNRSRDAVDASKAFEEINALDAQLNKGTKTAYGKSGQGKWMLDENGMPVRESMGTYDIPPPEGVRKTDPSTYAAEREAALLAEVKAKLSEEGLLPTERTGMERDTPLPIIGENVMNSMETTLKPNELPIGEGIGRINDPLRPPIMEMDPRKNMDQGQVGPTPEAPRPLLDVGTEAGATPFQPLRPAPSQGAALVEALKRQRQENAGKIDFKDRISHLTDDPMAQQMLRELDQRLSEARRGEPGASKRARELETKLANHGFDANKPWTTGEKNTPPVQHSTARNGLSVFDKNSTALPIEKSGTRDTRLSNDVGKPFDPTRNSLGKFTKSKEQFPTADGSGVVKLGNGGHFYYDPKVFARDFRHIVDFAKRGIRVIAQGVENGLQVRAFNRDGDRIGGSLFVPRNDFGTPDSTPLESRMTGVDKDFRGKGVAAAMYEVAADLGNTVVPSKSRTAEGRAMWENFEAKGLSKNKVILPKTNRGSIEGMGNSTLLKAWDRLTKKSEDPVTQHSSNVDLAAAGGKLPGVGKAFNGIDIPPAEPKSFLEYAKDWISDKSSDLSWGEKTRGVTTTAGANLLAKATKNPLVATVFHQIDNANRVSEALIKRYAQPLSSTARHMNKAEFSDVVYALQLKEGKGQWTKSQLLNSGMSEKQANWIMDFYKVDKLALDATNADRVARGEKPITARDAHMASTFLGDYRTLIKNKDGDIKYVISHNNKWMQKKALEAIEAKFPRKDFVYEELPFQRKNQRFDRDADAGFRILMDTLAKDDPTSAAIRNAYVAWKDKTAGHYLGQSQHAKAKSVEAVGGAEGLKLEKSFEQNAADSIQAQIRFFENSFQAAEMGKATHNLYKLLEDQTLRDNKPNSVAYALDYIENARGWRNNLLGDMSKAIETASGKAGLGTNLPGQISSILRSFLNAKLLGGWNPAFWYVNLVQMVNALPEMASVSGRIGDPSWAMAKFSEGSMKMLTNKLHTDPFWKEASDWARDHGISKSAIDIDTADIGKWKGMHTIDTVWNGPRRVIEEQTRRMVFGAFLEVLKDHYPKDQAFRMAAAGVERSLGDYRPFEKAMVFESGGFMGKNSGFLRTYTMNAFSQLGANLKSHEYGNFLKLFGILAFSSGVSGMIGVQQADWMINRYNEWFASKTGVRIPSVKEFLLKNGDKYFGKYADAVTFGPHSTLMDNVLPGGGGVDLSGRMGFQNVAPESLADLVMPGAGDLGKLAASGAKTLMNPTSKDSWAQLAHAAAPSSLKFLSESALERPDSQGNLKLVSPSSGQLTNYSRTDADNTIRKFNARSINESKALSKDFAHVSEERQLTKLRNEVMDRFGKEHASAKNNFEVHKLAKAAADRYLELGGNPDGVVEALEAAILKYQLTPKQREDLNANPMVIKRRQEYGN